MYENDPLLRVTGRLRPAVSVPGLAGYGTWSTFTWDNKGHIQHGAVLTPIEAPWRGLFAALDEEGRSLPDEPVDAVDEADAILACCWRFGSYAHVLTFGEAYPPFRRERQLSRLGDEEMMRINLEFASGLADWLQTRLLDPDKINRRVRVALRLLPITWREGDEVERLTKAQWFAREMAAQLAEQVANMSLPTATLRHEANNIVQYAYRNGPIEDLHAGTWSHGSEVPGFQRLYEGEIRQICRVAADRLAWWEMARRDPTMAPAMAAMAISFGAPHNWSVDHETSVVRYMGMPGAGPLGQRLAWLAKRYPALYRPST